MSSPTSATAPISIRASWRSAPAVAAKVNITYKILYNDAVAMTGGQPVTASLTVPQIARQLDAEGVGKIVVVTDEPEKYAEVTDLAPSVPIRHRDELDIVQRELREDPGVSVLIYDQTCAAEKRRRRKARQDGRSARASSSTRRSAKAAATAACSPTASRGAGRNRVRPQAAIDQSACNKDYSCLNGFCPSFVTVEGGSCTRDRLSPRGTSFGARSTAKTGRFCPPPPCLPPPSPTTF